MTRLSMNDMFNFKEKISSICWRTIRFIVTRKRRKINIQTRLLKKYFLSNKVADKNIKYLCEGN